MKAAKEVTWKVTSGAVWRGRKGAARERKG